MYIGICTVQRDVHVMLSKLFIKYLIKMTFSKNTTVSLPVKLLYIVPEICNEDTLQFMKEGQ